MPSVLSDDGVQLYYEECGSGIPIVFVHEFAGDLRSFEPQMRFFSRCYRCIAYNARGYPPSDVPEALASYSQQRATDDIRAVLDGLRIERAHVVGISMGAFATVHFALHYPERALSVVPGGCGYGSPPESHAQFAREAVELAERIEREGMQQVAEDYALTAARVQLQNKDPRGWAEFKSMLQQHSARGSALTLRGVQSARPSLHGLADRLAAVTVPMLIMSGDEDDPALDASLFLKRTVPSSALVLLPRTGHALNVEEPSLFNAHLSQFFHQVEAGRWTARDSRSVSHAILGRDG